MTPEEEIAGLKRILQGWKRDARAYKAGLQFARLEACGVRDTMPPPYDTRLEDIVAICTVYLNGDEPKQCDICGDHHEPGNIPRECETGDGV